MRRRVAPLVAAATLLVPVGCSNGAGSATPAVATADIAHEAKLQFGVGTATIGYPGGAFTGINFVATFRGSSGHSATLANTPTITGPGNVVSFSGILPNVFDAAVLAASKQTATFPQSFGATLGPFIGVFGYGFAGDNLLSSQVALQYLALVQGGQVCNDYNTQGINTQVSPSFNSQGSVNGVPVAEITSEAQSQELGLPLGYGQGNNEPPQACPVGPQSNVPIPESGLATSIFPINYYGGPPAWPSAQGYGQPAFFVGYPLGFTDIAVAPVAGSYALDVAYATNADSTTYGHFKATATLRDTTPLPALTINGATLNSDGTGSVTLTVPAGVTEAVVLVRTNDCTNLTSVDNYAVVTHSTGSQVLVFSAKLGPPDASGAPAPTFCNSPGGGPNATAFAVGFDYPAYESSYPFNVTQTPPITNGDGHTGQADVTTSAPFTFTTGS